LTSPRRLLLIRHAQAADGPVDADRPLTEDGAAQAAAIGTRLGRDGLVPDLVLVSPARRAVQTWGQAAATLGSAPEEIIDPRIYDNTVEAVLTAIRATPADVRTLAVVGHNPSVGELARVLDGGQGDPEARRTVDAGFRPSGVAVFEFAVPFAEIAPGAATLTGVALPGG
jgi:phosphohistidine phosphatase